MHPPVHHPPEAKPWLYAASLLSLGAAAVHIAAAAAYFSTWAGYGFFFVLAVTAQITFAVVLWVYPSLWADSPHPPLLWAGILGNGLIVALWLVTRTIGIPFAGPQAWEIQPVGALDLLSVVLELGLIAVVVILLRVYARLQVAAQQQAESEADTRRALSRKLRV
jgi:hypothetical protein